MRLYHPTTRPGKGAMQVTRLGTLTRRPTARPGLGEPRNCEPRGGNTAREIPLRRSARLVSKTCPHRVRTETNPYELLRSRRTKKIHAAQGFSQRVLTGLEVAGSASMRF